MNEKLSNTLDKIMKDGYKPTETAQRIIKMLGADLSAKAFTGGTISLRCNDDKTFDVVISKAMIEDSIERLKSALDSRGYTLTLKGEKHVNRAYNNNMFAHDALKDINKLS